MGDNIKLREYMAKGANVDCIDAVFLPFFSSLFCVNIKLREHMAKGAKVDIQYFAREYGILLFFFPFFCQGSKRGLHRHGRKF